MDLTKERIEQIKLEAGCEIQPSFEEIVALCSAAGAWLNMTDRPVFHPSVPREASGMDSISRAFEINFGRKLRFNSREWENCVTWSSTGITPKRIIEAIGTVFAAPGKARSPWGAVKYLIEHTPAGQPMVWENKNR